MLAQPHTVFLYPHLFRASLFTPYQRVPFSLRSGLLPPFSGMYSPERLLFSHKWLVESDKLWQLVILYSSQKWDRTPFCRKAYWLTYFYWSFPENKLMTIWFLGGYPVFRHPVVTRLRLRGAYVKFLSYRIYTVPWCHGFLGRIPRSTTWKQVIGWPLFDDQTTNAVTVFNEQCH